MFLAPRFDALTLLRRVTAGATLLLTALGLTTAYTAEAGDLSQADIARRFQAPLHVGDKLLDIPAWPITSELEPEAGPVAYAFESIDLAPIPGFEGTPINLLVSIDRKGNFMDVELLRQHEPVFLSGLGEGPLKDFLAQYANKSLKQEITVSSLYGNTRSGAGGNRVVLDGVSKATASVRIVNQTVLTSALAVARARLGFAATAEKGPVAEVRSDFYEALGFADLLKSGAIGHLHLANRDVEKLFAGSEGAGVDADALARPDDSFVDLYVAYLNAPTIGRAILGDAGHADLMRRLEPGQHAWWVASAGRDAFVDENFTRGTVPARLAFSQGGAPVELRDLDLAPAPPPGAPRLNAALVLRVPPMSGVDPAAPLRFELTITRAKGSMLPVLTQRSATLDYQAPAALFHRPPAPLPDWLLAWKDRADELAIIGAALALLAVVLARPRWISVAAGRLRLFRLGFLAFTLAYLGWYAQGQLSVVQITGAIKSLVAGAGLRSFLYDPVSLLLIAFTLISFVAWGRGTFCGWLCPFGALQEFVALLARHLRIPERRMPAYLGRHLETGRFVILGVLMALAAFAPGWAEKGVEIEPFKTAITVGFDRNLPYLAYALALLALGMLYYKFFCRYLCPLGAAMVLGGKLRISDWLPRRKECGQPCQTCRHRCAYDAIAKDGAIRYDNCFQCLDCVGIFHDEGRCAPIMLVRKRERKAAANAGAPSFGNTETGNRGA